MPKQPQHTPGEVWRHRTRDRTVKVVEHNVHTDNVVVETIGRARVTRSDIYGYNLRRDYAQVDDSTGIVGPVVAGESAAGRLMRSLDYRLSDASPLAPGQVGVVLHALADHTAIQAALVHEPDPGSPWPQATSVGRWLHDVADQVERTIPDDVERLPTAEEITLAIDVMAASQAGGMPDSYWHTDARVRRAAVVLGITTQAAAGTDWAGVTEWPPVGNATGPHLHFEADGAPDDGE